MTPYLIAIAAPYPMTLLNPADDHAHAEHSPEARAAVAARSTWISIVINALLSFTQITVGMLSRSQGLIADGIHSLSDLVADFIVLFANHHSKKDADTEHP